MIPKIFGTQIRTQLSGKGFVSLFFNFRVGFGVDLLPIVTCNFCILGSSDIHLFSQYLQYLAAIQQQQLAF